MMKKGIKYSLLSPEHKKPIGYFLDNFYYGAPFGSDIKQGEVRENGEFYTFIKGESSNLDEPIGKIEGTTFIRQKDSMRFELQEEFEGKI